MSCAPSTSPPRSPVCPFHAARLQTLRGSLQGRKGKTIFKTKYLQQQKLLGSPDLCDVIYVGEGGGLRRGIRSVQHLYHLYFNYRSQGNQYVEILYNRFIYIEYVYLKPSTDRVCVLLILCSLCYPSWNKARLVLPLP